MSGHYPGLDWITCPLLSSPVCLSLGWCLYIFKIFLEVEMSCKLCFISLLYLHSDHVRVAHSPWNWYLIWFFKYFLWKSYNYTMRRPCHKTMTYKELVQRCNYTPYCRMRWCIMWRLLYQFCYSVWTDHRNIFSSYLFSQKVNRSVCMSAHLLWHFNYLR